MHITVSENAKDLGRAAGRKAAALIRIALQERNAATIILATGTSQFETLYQLTNTSGSHTHIPPVSGSI
jgi:glucosamine-6-phosphate deaminase